ncbi:cbb3-type cytochrome c oxidase subunit I [Shigella flexneri]
MKQASCHRTATIESLPPRRYHNLLVAMPLVIGLMNVIDPLQIGARDVALPFLNNLSFWFTVVGVILVNLPLGIGEFARPAGWPTRRCRE